MKVPHPDLCQVYLQHKSFSRLISAYIIQVGKSVSLSSQPNYTRTFAHQRPTKNITIFQFIKWANRCIPRRAYVWGLLQDFGRHMSLFKAYWYKILNLSKSFLHSIILRVLYIPCAGCAQFSCWNNSAPYHHLSSLCWTVFMCQSLAFLIITAS